VTAKSIAKVSNAMDGKAAVGSTFSCAATATNIGGKIDTYERQPLRLPFYVARRAWRITKRCKTAVGLAIELENVQQPYILSVTITKLPRTAHCPLNRLRQAFYWQRNSLHKLLHALSGELWIKPRSA
jgi:hypothetical protein